MEPNLVARLQPISLFCISEACVWGCFGSTSVNWQLADLNWEELAQQTTSACAQSTRACCPPQQDALR